MYGSFYGKKNSSHFFSAFFERTLLLYWSECNKKWMKNWHVVTLLAKGQENDTTRRSCMWVDNMERLKLFLILCCLFLTVYGQNWKSVKVKLQNKDFINQPTIMFFYRTFEQMLSKVNKIQDLNPICPSIGSKNMDQAKCLKTIFKGFLGKF